MRFSFDEWVVCVVVVGSEEEGWGSSGGWGDWGVGGSGGGVKGVEEGGRRGCWGGLAEEVSRVT